MRRSAMALSLRWVARCCALLSMTAGAQGLSHNPDPLLHDGFESILAGPRRDADAARFLAQATFGPTTAEITNLRLTGYAAWFNAQFAAPVSTQVPYLDWVANLPPINNQNEVDDDTRLESWSINSAGTPDPSRSNVVPGDQLRQRVAFALSEIFVVSNANGTLNYQPWALASYYDMLARDAFANFRVLLEDVTKHPAMGVYLNAIQNQKADPAQNIHPDENYAREVLQLFSVGLVQLNLNGTPVLVGNAPVPTYDQTTVRGFAAVFTGWDFNNLGCGSNTYTCCNEDDYFGCGPSNADEPPWRNEMQAVEAFHDTTSDKQLLDYVNVARPNGLLLHGGNAQVELSAALDNIFQHPNVPPFISMRLIQRLVTSNPSPEYVQRVAQIFKDDSSAQHVRGNLKAVVQAILLDPEARYGQWRFPDSFGKVREPLVKSAQLWRAMAARSINGRNAALSNYPPIESWFGQAPLRAATVFNFFKPDFRPTGEMVTRNLAGPEFQILTDTVAVETPNYLFHQIFCNYVGSEDCNDSDAAETLSMDETRDAAMAAANPGQLVDNYSLLLMSGQMSPFMRNVLLTHLNSLTAADLGANLGRTRVQHALYLIANSPEYSIQK
ncbi:MAG: DUF1800 family protein [Tahibacter sp.]